MSERTSPHSATLRVVKRSLDDLQKASPEAAAVFSRAVIELAREMSEVYLGDLPRPGAALRPLLRQPDPDLLANLALDLVNRSRYVSPAARTRLQGEKAFADLLRHAGGVYREEEVAERLGSTPEAVREWQAAGRLLVLERGEARVYPVWQFGPAGVLPQLESILKRLTPRSAVARVRFFLTFDSALGSTPLDALREGRDRELVERLAAQFGEQGPR